MVKMRFRLLCAREGGKGPESAREGPRSAAAPRRLLVADPGKKKDDIGLGLGMRTKMKKK